MVYVYFTETDQSSDLILTRLNPTDGSYSSIETDGHRLLRDFSYYTYAILPLFFLSMVENATEVFYRSDDPCPLWDFGIRDFGGFE